jgi:hypothetical protein
MSGDGPVPAKGSSEFVKRTVTSWRQPPSVAAKELTSARRASLRVLSGMSSWRVRTMKRASAPVTSGTAACGSALLSLRPKV